METSIGFSDSSTAPRRKTPLSAYPFILVIYVYRFTLAPILGNSCRFYPTCSHYAEQSLRKYGVFKGGFLAIKRLLRCHPWHEGGYDPVK